MAALTTQVTSLQRALCVLTRCMTCREQQKSQLAMLSQLQQELTTKESEVSSLRSDLSVMETRFGDTKTRLETAETQLEEAKKEFAAQLEEARKDGEAKESAEAVALREANENLKVLLSGAEKKYMRISSLNLELQKKVDTLEQKSRMSLESV